MRPLFEYTGFATTDLTAVQVHRVTEPDGSARIVAYSPKTWEEKHKLQGFTANGDMYEHMMYAVLTWDETTLATIPAPESKEAGQ